MTGTPSKGNGGRGRGSPRTQVGPGRRGGKPRPQQSVFWGGTSCGMPECGLAAGGGPPGHIPVAQPPPPALAHVVCQRLLAAFVCYCSRVLINSGPFFLVSSLKRTFFDLLFCFVLFFCFGHFMRFGASGFSPPLCQLRRFPLFFSGDFLGPNRLPWALPNTLCLAQKEQIFPEQ